jgi:hypothetical protein
MNSCVFPNPLAASRVLTTTDLNLRPQTDLCKIISRFLAVGDGVIAHWVEFARGMLLFVMAPGDSCSGEFYIYDRKKGSFWLLSLADNVFGGYAVADMRQKIKDFRLLDYAEDPARLRSLSS